MRFRNSLIVIFVLFGVSQSLAQDQQGVTEKLASEKLASDQGISRQMLIDSRLDEYRGLLLEPVSHLVERKQLVAKVVQQLENLTELTSKFIESSEPSQFNEDATIVLPPSFEKGRELPFSVSSQIETEADLKKKANMILWNAAYLEAAAGDILYELNFSWTGVQSVLRKAGGIVYRNWSTNQNISYKRSKNSTELSTSSSTIPPSVSASASSFVEGSRVEEPEIRAEYFMTELFQLQSPPVVMGLAYLLHRFEGRKEDLTWEHSPVVGRNRKTPTSLRTDPLFDGLLSVEDLFVWSGRIQDYEAKFVAERDLLVGFPSASSMLLEENRDLNNAPTSKSSLTSPEVNSLPSAPVAPKSSLESSGLISVQSLSGAFRGKGPLRRSEGTLTTVSWNHETQLYSGYALWNPTSAVFAPRRVWVIQLWPKNPFVEMGRQILVIDKSLGLPVYKLVYDRLGNLQRTVIGGWGMAFSKDKSIVLPYSSFVFSTSSDGRDGVTVSTDEIATYAYRDKPSANKLRRLLSIENHGSKDEREESTTSSSASTSSTLTTSSSASLELGSEDRERIPVDPRELEVPGSPKENSLTTKPPEQKLGSELEGLPPAKQPATGDSELIGATPKSLPEAAPSDAKTIDAIGSDLQKNTTNQQAIKKQAEAPSD